MDYVKIILLSYPALDRLIYGLNESLNLRCKNSFYFWEPAEKMCNKILEKRAVINKLVDLKRKLDVLFSRLTDEEKDLIYLKYFEIAPKKRFSFSLRTYFRKQNGLLKKIQKYLSYMGIDGESFERDFMGMQFFQLIELKCNMIKRKNGATKLEAEFFSG